MYSRKQIEDAVLCKGYKWFENGDYNLNIVGVRNSNTNQEITNKFDDKVTVSYSVNGELKYEEWDATTDPGIYYSENLLNPDGVYSLQEGMFGINIHRAGTFVNGSTQIDKWSAGCQVLSKESDFNILMELAEKARALYGNSFTYTLIESSDIVG